MRKQYEPQGLVVISLAIDPNDPAKPEVQKQVLEFLKSQKASFRNVVPGEGENVDPWEEKFAPEGLPARWVYDRDGKAKRFDGGGKLEDMEKYVKELLAKK